MKEKGETMDLASNEKKLKLIYILTNKIAERLDLLAGKLKMDKYENSIHWQNERVKIRSNVRKLIYLNNNINRISFIDFVKEENTKTKRGSYFIKSILKEVLIKFKSIGNINIDYKLEEEKVFLDKEKMSKAFNILLENFVIFNAKGKKVHVEVINTEKDLTINLLTEGTPSNDKFLYNEKLDMAESLIKDLKGEIRIKNSQFITIFIPTQFKKMLAIKENIRRNPFVHFFTFIFDSINFYIKKISFRKKGKIKTGF